MTENAYFAGLIDGEGCISIQKHSRKPNTYEGCIEVKMTCEKTIDALQKHFGGHLQFRRPEKPHYKPQWRWRVKAKKARAALKAILPHLITKRANADKLIRMWKERGLW